MRQGPFALQNTVATDAAGLASGSGNLLAILLAEFQRRQRFTGTRHLHLDAVVVIVLEIERETLGLGQPVHHGLIVFEDAAHGGLVHDLPLRLLHDIGVIGPDVGPEDLADLIPLPAVIDHDDDDSLLGIGDDDDVVPVLVFLVLVAAARIAMGVLRALLD